MAGTEAQQNNKAVAFGKNVEREVPMARKLAKRGLISQRQMEKMCASHAKRAHNRDDKL